MLKQVVLFLPSLFLFVAHADEVVIDSALPGFVKVCWSEKDGARWEVKGLADRETGRLMATNTVFAIASNTKPIASVLVLSLVEEGVLDLNAPVAQYLPEMTNITFEGRSPDRPILLRHLITHLSGLPYLYKDPVRKPDRVPYSEHVAFAIRRGLCSQPGVAYRYCGLGFQVMGAVIEKVTGRRVFDLMKERIFDPLEMAETTFYPNAEMLSRVALLYYYPPSGGNPVYFGFGRSNSKPLDDTTRTAILSGGLFSTAVDYLKFSQMIARKGIGMNGRRILSEATFERWLLTRQTPPGDVKDASFDIQFNKDHTGGGKGGYWGTHAFWNWSEKSCEITFRAKSPNPPGRKEGVNLQDVPIPPMEAN